MRQLTVTIPDDFYDTFVSFIKHIPGISIDEKLTKISIIDESILDEIPTWQQIKISEDK